MASKLHSINTLKGLFPDFTKNKKSRVDLRKQEERISVNQRLKEKQRDFVRLIKESNNVHEYSPKEENPVFFTGEVSYYNTYQLIKGIYDGKTCARCGSKHSLLFDYGICEKCSDEMHKESVSEKAFDLFKEDNESRFFRHNTYNASLEL